MSDRHRRTRGARASANACDGDARGGSDPDGALQNALSYSADCSNRTIGISRSVFFWYSP